MAAPEIGDAAAAGGDQQLGGLAGAVAVVAEDAVDAGVLDDPAHQDDRHAEAGAALGDFLRGGAGGDDDGVGLIVERAHQSLVDRVIALDRADQQPPVAPGQGFGEGVEEQGIEDVAGAAHDQGDQIGAVADQAAGQGVGPVAEPFSAAAMTLARVSAEALAPSVKTRETAEAETPAARATSLMVTLLMTVSVTLIGARFCKRYTNERVQQKIQFYVIMMQ